MTPEKYLKNVKNLTQLFLVRIIKIQLSFEMVEKIKTGKKLEVFIPVIDIFSYVNLGEGKNDDAKICATLISQFSNNFEEKTGSKTPKME